MYSSDEEETLLLMALAEDEANVKKVWVHPINQLRESCGEFNNLVHQLRSDEKRFHLYFRMTPCCFDKILNLIGKDIQKQYTHFRQPISIEERLAITLRYFATGDSFCTKGHSFHVGFSTVSSIVKEVSDAIIKNMEEMYLPQPTTAIWEKSSKGFMETWKFPNCIGSIDGKHITIKCPRKSGSNYWCYLHKFSLVLMAIVGPDYRFICIDIGGFGKNSDGGIFENSNMGVKFEMGAMNVPDARNLPGENEPCPFVLVGDEAFALKSYLVRPFPNRQLKNCKRKENFNYRLCRARRVVENAFGILAQKWRIFYRPIETKVDTTINIVRCACILHNFCIEEKSDDEIFEQFDPQTANAFSNNEINPRRATQRAFDIRDQFVEYFSKNNT